MTRSAARPRGRMTLTLLDARGRPLARHDNPNEVLESGRDALLQLLGGKVASGGLSLVLATPDFSPEMESIDTGRGVLALRNARKPRIDIGREGLQATFRGDAAANAEVVGGALLLGLREADGGDDAPAKPVLYNYAKLREPVRVESDQPLSVQFTLTME